MPSLLRVKMKEEIFKKENLLILIIIPVLIVFACVYLDKNTKDQSNLYSVAIIDHDETTTSLSLIGKIKEYKEIDTVIDDDLEESLRKLYRGKYDVVYEIKDGFENKILKGDFNNIMVSHKEVDSRAVNWLNDQISLVVIRNWLYVDAFNKVRSLDSDFQEEEFKLKFEEAMTSNKILSMEIKKVNKDKSIIKENDNSVGQYVFKILWAGIILFLLTNFGKNVVCEREKGIIVRLKLSGISEIQYYGTGLIIQFLSIIIPFIISHILFKYLAPEGTRYLLTNILLTSIYIIFTWCIVILTGLSFNSKKSYNFASQVFLLLSIILGSGLLDGTYKLLNYVSWLFPIKWYMHFLA